MTLPTLESHLPELSQFTQQLARELRSGTLTGWQPFVEQVRQFYTPTMMDKIERAAPGWQRMASFRNQTTLIHVTSVLTAMYLLPEYQQAVPDQQRIIEWMVLFHDIAKVIHDKHDFIHGFRSAAVAGKALANIGFPVINNDPAVLDNWCDLTSSAIIFDEVHQEEIQDNSRLPEIISGIEAIYGADAPAVLAVKGILFHLSIKTDPDYPTLAPLTDQEIHRYINAAAFPILKAMMLVDTDGWNLFDKEEKRRHRQQNLNVMNWIGSQIKAL
jgi:hypothetical protein